MYHLHELESTHFFTKCVLGERFPTLAGLLPSLRAGVLLADIAAAAAGEKFVVRPTSKTPHRIWAHIQTGFGPTPTQRTSIGFREYPGSG